MANVQMSIHRALSELKLLDSKINRSFDDASFVAVAKKSATEIMGVSINDFTNKIIGCYDNVESLISNRQSIKDAIVLSNANTMVRIGGEEMTVAAAIERKSSIAYDKRYLTALKIQYTNAVSFYDGETSKLQSKLEQYLQVVLGEKDKRNVEDIKQHTKMFEENNGFAFINPRNISDYIDKLENRIHEFEANVDYVLSESNATTMIEVELRD